MMDIQDAQIYVGTYRKYNEGSLFGKWLVLSDYSDFDEFIEACMELHIDEYDPELMFQDWEGIPDSLISECWLSDKFFDLRGAVDTLENNEQEAFFVWTRCFSHDLSSEDTYDLVSKFREEYQGKYDSQEDFAFGYVENCYDLSDFALSYFDYDKFASDLFITDYWEEDGHVFRRC